MKALFLTLLLALSCTKYATFDRDTIGVEIKPVTMQVSHLNEITWLVGQRREEKISQSFTFIIDLPKIKDQDLDFLRDEKGIDAWILRLIAVRGPETQDLGSLYSLFRQKKMTRGVQAGTASTVSMKVFYAAAYASERLRNFKCPAFGHTKRISSMTIEGSNDEFSITVGQSVPYNEKSQLVELSPSAFNGGNSLTGNYYIEIAAYDSKKKMTLSPWKRIPMHVRINSEEIVRVSSCDGIHEEMK